MSQAANCNCPCPDPEVVEIPGSPGADGADGAAGTNGINAFTVTTLDFTLPGSAGPVAGAISVGVSSWASIGQVLIITNAFDDTQWAHFRVLTIPGSTSFTLDWLDYPGDVAAGTTFTVGSTVSPSGVLAALAVPLPTAVDYSALTTAGAVDNQNVAAGVGLTTLTFEFDLATLTTGASEILTNYTPGYAFKIFAVDFVVTDPGVGAGATQTINMEIGSTNLTGGVVNPTEANTATQGALVAGTAVTANNVGTAASTISIEVAAGGTIFTAGTGILLVKIMNLDTANAVAALADHINDLITSLT